MEIQKKTETILETLQQEKQEVVCFGDPGQETEAELYVVGSWTDKGTCDQEISDFLKKLKGKKIAYFGTAGFGGSVEYYEKLYERAMENTDSSNQMVGTFSVREKCRIRFGKDMYRCFRSIRMIAR